MPRDLGRSIRGNMRFRLTLAVAWIPLALYCGYASSENLTQSLVRVEGARADGSRIATIAVVAGADTVVASCRSIADAVSLNVVGPGARIPLTLSSIAVLDDLCRFRGYRGGVPPSLSPRSTSGGAPITLLGLQSGNASEWHSRSAPVKYKRDAGNRRAIYLDASDVTASKQESRSTAALAAFDSNGGFLGIATPVPGSDKLFGLLQIEDIAAIKWQDIALEATKKPQHQGKGTLVPAAMLDEFGLTLTFVDLVEVYARTGNADKLIALADRWKKTDPANPLAYTAAALALNRLSFAEQSSQDLDQALRLAPQYLRAMTVKVSILNRQNKKTEAEVLATKALQVQPADDVDEGERVLILTYLKRHDDAVELARRMLLSEPQAPDAKFAVCTAETGAQHADAALAACKDYVTAVPDSVGGWGRLASVYRQLNRLEDSLEAAKKAIEINPEFPEGWMWIGIVAEAKGDSQRASEAEQHVQELDSTLLPRMKTARAAQACYREFRSKNYSNAVSACSDASRLDDQNGMLQTVLGSALLREKRLDEGIAAHEKALRLNPKIKQSWIDLAFAYAAKHDSIKTRDAFEHLRTVDSSAADAIYPKIRNAMN